MTEFDDTRKFTDEELAFLRYARFSELPARPRPEDLVETIETEQPWIPVPQFDPGTQGPPAWT